MALSMNTLPQKIAMFDYTKRKFLSLAIQKQHKCCSEILRFIYESPKECSLNWETYLQLLNWMDEPLPLKFSIKIIADRYHHHLKKALISKREHHLLPSIRQGDRLQGEEPWPIAIYLDGIRSAHNVGSMIRTTEAFALGKLYFSPSTPSEKHKQVKDAAMGSEQWVSCSHSVPLSALPQPIIAMETSKEAISLFDFIFPDSFTLVMGNEEVGCSDEAIALSDYLIEIPLRGRKNSLNVANAFAIAAGEISRQNQKKAQGIK